jgi:hypothetical protein
VTVNIFIGSYQDVVHINKEFHGVSVGKGFEDAVHCSTEGGRGIGETERHYFSFMHAKGSFERSLPLIVFFDKDVIEAPPKVHFGEQRFSLEVVNYTADQGEGVNILDCPGIEGLVVYYGMEFTI